MNPKTNKPKKAIYDVGMFRSNMREAFNLVDEGTEVYVRRYGVNYQVNQVGNIVDIDPAIEEEMDTKELVRHIEFEEKVEPTGAPAIMVEINAIRKERDDRLEFCQDREEIDNINAEYQPRLDHLWAKFREAKGAA